MCSEVSAMMTSKIHRIALYLWLSVAPVCMKFLLKVLDTFSCNHREAQMALQGEFNFKQAVLSRWHAGSVVRQKELRSVGQHWRASIYNRVLYRWNRYCFRSSAREAAVLVPSEAWVLSISHCRIKFRFFARYAIIWCLYLQTFVIIRFSLNFSTTSGSIQHSISVKANNYLQSPLEHDQVCGRHPPESLPTGKWCTKVFRLDTGDLSNTLEHSISS